MLKLTDEQIELVNKLNKEAELHYKTNPDAPFPSKSQWQLGRLFDDEAEDSTTLEGLMYQLYFKDRKLVNLSNPQEEHNLALKFALFKAPKDFSNFSDQDIKDLLKIFKTEYTDTDAFNKVFDTAGKFLKGKAKVIAEGAKELNHHYGFIKGDDISIELLKRFDFANRDPELFTEVFGTIIEPNMLTSEAWEYSRLTADILSFKEDNKTKERMDILHEANRKSQEQQNKNHHQLKEKLVKQGFDIDMILKNTEELKEQNEESEKMQEEILFYAALNNKLQVEMVERMATQAKQEEIKSYFNAASDVGNLLIQLGQVTGSKDLQKFGVLAVASTQAFYAACQITGSLGVTAVSGIAMITPVTAMIAGALAVVSILSSKNKDNKAMAAMFDQLFSALNTIHKEMHEQFDLVHKELFHLFEAVHESIKRNEYNFIKVSDKLEGIARFQEFSHKEIVDAVHANLISEINKAIFMITNNKMSEKLDDKLKHLENLDYAANHLAFDNVLNNPDKSPDLLFIDKSIEQQLENRPLEQNIGFLINYAKTILGIQNLAHGKEIPNPALFFSVTNVLPSFLLDIVNQDTEKAEYVLETLGATIATNNRMISTIQELKQQNVVGKMLHIYNIELEKITSYMNNENVEYSQALGLIKTLSWDLPTIMAAYVEENKILIATREKPLQILPNLEDLDLSYFLPDEMIMANKIGLEDKASEYFHYLWEGGAKDSRLIDAVATKLQSARAEFINKLTSEPKFKEHINKLKLYEKMVSFYSALTGEAMNINYINTFENYLNSAKASHANEGILMNPVDYFYNQCIWFIGDNSKITISHNKWHASNSIYLEFADKIQQSLDYTKVILNQVKAYNEIPKTDFLSSQVEKESNNVLKHLKSYFEAINVTKDELVADFPKNKHNELGKFTKYFNAAKFQVDELETAPAVNQLEGLYCNIFCTDKVLKFHVKSYRDATYSDETLLDIKNELKDFSEKAIICDC
ncbi:hypothetical protein H1Q59_06625 [Holosporaceae bacterium 'Namur']|nr:hypothetical protein [Holosporaceae bacterium 'Namur']